MVKTCCDASRVGIGHDIHALYPGHPLVLGGITVPAERGFSTTTDGDVLCHAIIDAMAGAMADADLGVHFPEDDPELAEARSIDLLAEFTAYAADRCWSVAQVDSYIVLGTTRLQPHLSAMSKAVAAALAADTAAVSVKSRSNDGFGPEGRGEAASATAIVVMRRRDVPANE